MSGEGFRVIILIAFVLTFVACAVDFSFGSYVYADPFEVDATCDVYRVVDGDTFDCFPVGRVRLADINAPELNTPGGPEAKKALTGLVLYKRVYLDVDDRYVMDRYNRVVAVAYVRYNETHLLNVKVACR